MYRNLISALLFFLAVVPTIQAQQNPVYEMESPYQRYTHNLATLRWVATAPMGSIKDGYVDEPSFLNYALSVEWVFREMPISAGIDVGKYYFKQRYPRALYQMEQNEVSAVRTSTFTNVPVTGFLKYHFLGSNAQVAPYVQVNLGAHFNEYTNYFGSLADQKKITNFGYGGAAGVKLFVKKDGGLGFDLAVRYDQNGFKYGAVNNGLGMLSGSVGVIYRWW